MLQIPPDRLSADVLDALIEEFVTRHGTELTDATAKAAQVRAKLRTGEVIIVFDETHETTNIVPKTEGPLEEPTVERGVEYEEGPRWIDEPDPFGPAD
jgi:uncharacterized protein